ncbi:hypothetical protein GOBAR_AA35569 [Gossypium barbadense]|uniref:Uncharacterized protein n=1 Tax=Gossypium barbadense TaxID=3634 RepID=A0A2P5W204_GOSBA|nr:hypothetical protein GOBAR_AA35569 [Gossypium barbadense]
MASEKEAALAAAPSDSPTIFDKIINKEIPATVVYEDDKAEERHCEILGCLLYTAKLVAKQEGLEDGFRIVINDGPKGCLSICVSHSCPPHWRAPNELASRLNKDVIVDIGISWDMLVFSRFGLSHSKNIPLGIYHYMYIPVGDILHKDIPVLMYPTPGIFGCGF